MRILVVEDERQMADLLRRALSEEGHVVTVAHDGLDGLRLSDMGPAHTQVAKISPFELIILDVMLPGIDGFEIAQRLRSQRNQTPILMLTARDSTRDVVEGLNLGADDYLTKPFSLEVLLARVRAAGRRGPIPQPVTLQVGDLVLNQGTREVWRGKRIVSLTRTEFAILELLMRHAGRVLSRDTLIETVWGGNSDIESNTLDVFVRLLRGKIESPTEPRLLQTVRGVGYALRLEQS